MTAIQAQTSEACETTVSVAVVRALIEAVEKAGVSRARLLRAAQLPADCLDGAETRIAGIKAYELCVKALELTDDPAFGLHWAERLTASALVPVSHLLAHSANLRQALESFARFHRLLSDRRYHDIIEADDTVTVRCTGLVGSSRMQRFAGEMVISFFFHLVRSFDLHARPRCVSFAYPAPPYRAEYTRIFEGTERFEQPFTGIVFDRTLLDQPAPHPDGAVHDALEAVAEQRLLRITQSTPWSMQVHEILVRHATPHRCDMLMVARSLGMSTRSLRRRLAAEGKSYNAVFDEALASVAKRLLQGKQLTIQETAYELGFSDARTFHRAFKRWTGMTPTTFREGR
jgi:AraC-like DNA-binding protein